MCRTRWLAALLACWVLVAAAGLSVAASPPAAASGRCWSLDHRQGEVPDWLWALRIEPGSRYDDVRDRVEALNVASEQDGSIVDPVTHVPELSWAPAGVDWWVYDFGFESAPGAGEAQTYQYLGPSEDALVERYRPVVCLGGRVPEAVGETVDEAERLVEESGLTPEGDGGSSWLVTELSPSPGQVVEFGTRVRITARPAVRDLAVQEPRVDIVNAERLEVRVAVVNMGEVPVDGARLLLEFAGSRADCELPELQPGAEAVCEGTLQVPPDVRGSASTLVALLEPTDDDPSNNERGMLVQIPEPETSQVRPDLVVEGLVARAVDGGAQVEGAVVNRGDGDAAGTTVLLRAGDAAPISIPVPPLPAGGTASFNRTILLPDDLDYVTVEVRADPDDLVPESNDQNNVDSQELVLLSRRSGTTDTQDGAGSGTQQTREETPARWWLAAVAALVVVAAGALAIRAAHHRRGRDWVHRHVQVRVERDPGQQSVQQQPDHTRSHTVRIEPEPGQAHTLVEEVEQP